MNLLEKIRRKWIQLRLRPIRVFCFHQTSDTFVPDVYCKPDWIPLSFLKNFVTQLQSNGFEFISLNDAYRHIKKDVIRTRKYAVLTADDGLLCQLDLLPWLEEQHIPLTMFVNIKNLDGNTCGWPVKNYFKISNEKEEIYHASKLYCTKERLFAFSSPMLSVGIHGFTHDRATDLSEEEFECQLHVCQKQLCQHPGYIPYFAYPYGSRNNSTDKVLWEKGIIPVLADGTVNYNDPRYIHREILENICHNQH